VQQTFSIDFVFFLFFFICIHDTHAPRGEPIFALSLENGYLEEVGWGCENSIKLIRVLMELGYGERGMLS